MTRAAWLLMAFSCVLLAQPSLRTQARARKASGDAAGALAAIEQAAAAEPTAADLQDEAGFLLAVLGRRDEAILRFRAALALNPRYAPAHYHLGVALWLKPDSAHAIRSLQEAVRWDTANAEYRSRLASMLHEAGRVDEALTEARAGVRIAPRPELWNLIGSIEQNRGALPAARHAFAQAVQLRPTEAEYRHNLGFVLLDLGLGDEGLAQFRAALQRDPANVRAQINVGYALLQREDTDAALAHFTRLARLHPEHAVIRYDLGLALKQKDRLDEARREFREALRLNPDMAEAYYTLGITAWQDGDFAGTVEAMRGAVARQPDYAAAHYMLGTALKQQGELAPAAEALEAAIRLDPASPGPFNTLAQIRQAQGDAGAARRLFAQAAEAKEKLESAQAKRLGAMGPATRDAAGLPRGAR
ncbi:MAG: tetratricopeptide repeat protein [Bryobacterales bacterium]|nr:tetratricopeptide repeat protein [Bryobacterales bacterium]